MISVNNDGLPYLVDESHDLYYEIDNLFLKIANKYSMVPLKTPSIVKVTDLYKIDYFDNFPHLSHIISNLDVDSMPIQRTAEGYIHNSALMGGNYAIPSAACYTVYPHFQDRTLDKNIIVTVRGDCCRKEKYYDSLRRLRSFSMREFVIFGNMDFVKENLAILKDEIISLLCNFDIPHKVENAADPFFDTSGGRALLQKASTSKQEIVVDDIAISSINFHRNFFGEKFNINLGGVPIYSGCIGMGLERWVDVFLKRSVVINQ